MSDAVDVIVVGAGNAAACAALAARECGVARFIGFDIDEGYLSEARERLAPDLFSA